MSLSLSGGLREGGGLLLALVWLLPVVATASDSFADGQPARPVIELKSGSYRIGAEYAATAASRRHGLGERHTLAENRGMLFVFSEPKHHCMWMRRTYLPLSVAFLAHDGTVINVTEMAPGTDDRYCAARPAHYALEMNGGWFAKRGIGPGSRIRGIEKTLRGR